MEVAPAHQVIATDKAPSVKETAHSDREAHSGKIRTKVISKSKDTITPLKTLRKLRRGLRSSSGNHRLTERTVKLLKDLMTSSRIYRDRWMNNGKNSSKSPYSDCVENMSRIIRIIKILTEANRIIVEAETLVKNSSINLRITVVLVYVNSQFHRT